jgi:hypothetical protein
MKTILWKATALLPLAVFAGLWSGCVGNIGDSDSSNGESGPGSTPLECKTKPVSPGDTLARRMTRFEYNNTIRDLLGDKSNPADQFPADDVSGVFDNQASALSVSTTLAQSYMNAAESLATNAAKDIDKLTNCDVAKSSEKACGAGFIKSFGTKAFRHPMTSAESSLLTNVFDTALSKWDYPTAIRLVIQTALQSPHFLYRIEFGTPDAAANDMNKLNGYEIASRLSYLFWGSMPDDALFAAAEKNELSTPEQLATQAKRLLDDPRAHAVIEDFHTQWLGLGILDTVTKDLSVYPNYVDSMKTTWEGETKAFIDHVIFDGEGDFTTLLTASYTMANKDVAALYGVSNGPTSDKYEQLQLPKGQRSGILTQPSLMAAYGHAGETAPVQRGRFIRERLLCEPVSPPPPNVNAVPPSVNPNVTLRKRFKEHEQNSVCNSCHHLMDPIGFGFENYDAVGLYRTRDQGLPVNANGEILDSVDADGPFDGAVELGKRLAGSDQVRQCFTTEWFRFAYGRAESSDDACSLARLQKDFKASGYSVKSLLVALTQTDTFRYRVR